MIVDRVAVALAEAHRRVLRAAEYRVIPLRGVEASRAKVVREKRRAGSSGGERGYLVGRRPARLLKRDGLNLTTAACGIPYAGAIPPSVVGGLPLRARSVAGLTAGG